MTCRAAPTIKRPKKGDVVLCWYPDMRERPYKATVLGTETRLYGVYERSPNGFTVTVTVRPPCKICGHAKVGGEKISLGCEWIDPAYVRKWRKGLR